jgi:hypothetical protein
MPRHGSDRYFPLPTALIILVTAVLFSASTPCATASESYLASAFSGGVSVFDLTTSHPIETVNAGANNFSIGVGPNPRLAFLSTGQYLSVIDLTIQREITRMPQAAYSRYEGFSPDGRYLLKMNQTLRTLDVIDVAGFRIARRVRLAGILRNGSDSSMGSIVIVGNKAYVTTKHPSPTEPSIALVDLRTFRARAVAIPNRVSSGGRCLPNAAATPDGKYVVMIQGTHLVFLNTATNTIAIDETLPSASQAIAITPNGNDPSRVFGYLLRRVSGNYVASVVDLRPGSPTFGQLIAGTDVILSNATLSGLAINPEGTRLVVPAQQINPNSPLPNLLVIDTSLMFTNPAAAIVGQATAANGGSLEGVTIATIVTSRPATAPVVNSVSGNVVNDTDTTIHVFGANFLPGARVRVGSMAPLPATVLSSSDLEVTIPQNAPAGLHLDVIVTNPNVNSPPSSQNQSGLLAGGITISPTPAFQPHQQFATALLGGSPQVYDVQRQSMVNLQTAPPLNYQVVFNADGAELYGFSWGPAYWSSSPEALEWKLADGSLQATVPVTNGTSTSGISTLQISVNPFTQGPILYAPGNYDMQGNADLVLNMIDTNPASGTFNTIIHTIDAQLGLPLDYFQVNSFAATRNGQFVYMNYLDGDSGLGMLAIFDILNGGPARVLTMSSLGADDLQYSLQISPDGRFLLLQAYYDSYSGYDILVFDIDNYPEPPTLVATITGNVPGPYPPYLYYFQVVGNRLFALDTNSNSVLAFNFVPPSNFSQLAAYQLPSAYGGLTVSPDGALIYLPISNPDMITVLDANQLINGQAPLITNIATGVFPYQVAVSPLTAKHRVGPPVSRPPVESRGEAGFTHNSVGAKGLDKTF